jgi:hypothetical protein
MQEKLNEAIVVLNRELQVCPTVNLGSTSEINTRKGHKYSKPECRACLLNVQELSIQHVGTSARFASSAMAFIPHADLLSKLLIV